jgi:hypothetical protein
MSKFTSPLNNVKVASPCSQNWNEMIGNERKRFCSDCKLNVYNLSGMTRDEAENLIMNAEGRLCVRFYKRADGSVITQDCPVGWAKVKQRTQVVVTAAASLVFSFLGAIGLQAAFSQSKLLSSNFPIPFVTPTPEKTMGIMVKPSPTPKQTPTPRATPDENEMTMGEIAPIEDREIVGKIVSKDNRK